MIMYHEYCACVMAVRRSYPLQNIGGTVAQSLHIFPRNLEVQAKFCDADAHITSNK